MLESVIQSRIIKKLEAHGWYVIKLIQTNKNGIHDLLCLKDGTAVFVEVKSETGKQRDLQKYRDEEIKANGFKTLIVSTEKNIENLL